MAGPNVENTQILKFTAADQETSNVYYIHAISWVSDQAQDKDIAADDDMLLEDGDGEHILGKRAEAAGDGIDCWNPGNFKGIYAKGLKAEDLDGGYLYVYVTRA